MTTATAVSPARAARPSSNWTSWGQWIALVTMTLDHVARYVAGSGAGLGWVDSTVGRIAFPLFAGMVAWHGLFNTRNPIRYARRVMVIGVVAQLPYQLMPREALVQFNICFTLGLGLLAGTWLVRLQRRYRQRTASAGRLVIEAVLMVAAWYLIGPWVEYSHLGLLLVPFFMLAVGPLFRTGPALSARLTAVAACLPILAVAGMMNSSDMAKSFTVVTALGVLLLAAGASALIPASPLKMPRRMWLAWYPGHFAVIALYLLAVGQADFGF
ncbi:MAG: conjugal transfer protein TraX [Halomonas subglaciescola]|nr:conjugal transfer protein TraX [Halomonas subglaciescola]